MNPNFWHRQTITVFRALLSLLCLGMLSLAIAADQPHVTESDGTDMLIHSDTAAAHAYSANLRVNRHRNHGIAITVAADPSPSTGHQVGNHEEDCKMPCDSVPACSSLCAVACSSATASFSSNCATALTLPKMLVSVPPLQGIHAFVGVVSSPLYRPPIFLI
ncbi:MAG: hypothetical protein ACI9XK_005065 [Granulosicoccus sp.]|jgi:hypothetical protein